MYQYKRIKRKGVCIDEHRIVWIKANGPIPKGMIIHHINGNPRDNRLENLELTNRSKHAVHHVTETTKERLAAESKSRRKIKKGFSWCTRCRQFLRTAEFDKDKSRWNGFNNRCRVCQKECRRAYSKKPV